MKRLLLLYIICFSISSCAVTHDRIISPYFLDFRPYSEINFFISPDPYPGQFTPVGELVITVIPARLPRNNHIPQQGVFNDGIYNSTSSGIMRVTTERISAAELLDIAVSNALKTGANGIANFKCEIVYNTSIKSGNIIKELDCYQISGLCIKTNE